MIDSRLGRGYWGFLSSRVEVGGAQTHRRPKGALMDADLDLLLTAVYVTVDDLLPQGPGNAKRIVTDAEVVTLCVAQAIMGIPSDRRFVAVASKHLRHLFPRIPGQAGYHKRRRRLADTLEWLMGVFASQSPGSHSHTLLVDSTPVECAPRRERSAWLLVGCTPSCVAKVQSA